MGGSAWAQTPSHVTVGGNVFGGGNLANVGGSSTVLVNQSGAVIGTKNGEGDLVAGGDVYGGGALAHVNTTDGSTLTDGKTTQVTVQKGTVYGNVYGGGLGVRPADENDPSTGTAANVFGPVTVSIIGGTVENSVFGCNNLYGAPQSTVTVVIEQTESSMTVHNVYGGGNLATYTAPAAPNNEYPVVNINHGTVAGSVFGGGYGSTAVVAGNPQVLIGDDENSHTATVNINVYGGGDEAAVTGSPTVTVKNAHSTVAGDVYGGGNQANVSNNTTVYILNGTIGQDVYGGGAFAHVGTSNSDQTTVNVLGGTVTRDVYGGGLGRKAADAVGQEGEPGYVPAQTAIAAAVNGVVMVNIGKREGDIDANGFATTVSGDATIRGSVFGCNNTNGSPKDNVTVNIWKTARTAAQETTGNQYALSQVFGGGNQAHYQPTSTGKKATVHVWTCDNTIEYLYGGGNAADLGTLSINSATDVIIDGGRIEWVFGGGNGYSETGNHSDPDGANYNPGANINGNTSVTFHAGDVSYIFGGSNQYGNVSGTKTVEVPADGTCTTKHIGELYGGSNEAPTLGDVSLTMGCQANTCDIDYLFGGSRNADIGTAESPANVELTVSGGAYNYVFGGNNLGGTIFGNVTLNLYGGTINNAFGGNNQSGYIKGKITVNVLDHLTCPLVLHNVYGGGYDAPYNPTTSGAYPEVNIIHGTVSTNDEAVAGTTGNVFGGGYGTTAVVKSNPLVRVGYDASMSAYIPNGYLVADADKTAVVQNNVYGGGDLAAVAGSTTVTIQHDNSTVMRIFGGGNQASVGNAAVNVTGGAVSTGVYGGCNTSGSVGGDIVPYTATLNITTNEYSNAAAAAIPYDGNVVVNVTHGTIGTDATSTANVHGGGYGQSTSTTGNVAVNIGAAPVLPSTTPTGDAVIWGDVYGGSADGSVNSDGDDHTWVTLYGGTINGSLYGGGLGIDNANCNVNGVVKVTVEGGYVKTTSNTTLTTGAVFGCNNAKGSPKSIVEVEVNSTAASIAATYYQVGDEIPEGMAVGDLKTPKEYALQGVYGGGNLAAYDPTNTYSSGETVYPKVTVNGCTSSIKDVYGGGNAAPVPNSKVVIKGGDIGRVFAGGNGESGTPAHIGWKNTDVSPTTNDYGTGIASAEIKGGTILQVFGGSNANGVIRISSSVDVDKSTANGACDMKVGEVYGGGNEANGNAGTITIGCTGTLVALGSGEHYGVDQEGIGYVYGGANQANVSNDIVLNINSGIVENVFGGNNTSGNISGTIQVNINKTSDACDWYVGNVYGGGNLAAYGNTPDVNIINGTVSGSVFGGGNQAGVGGGDVAMTGGAVLGGLYGGCNTSGVVNGNITVSITNGTIGADANTRADVFGGGYGALTSTTGNVNVTVDGTSVTVYGDVYGGSALGSVNDAAADITKVWLKRGTVNGNLYGGGLGRQADDSDPLNHIAAVAALVNGAVTVDVNGGTVTDVFGCNNLHGSPQHSVVVNINETDASTMTVNNVYGGGDEAAYGGTPEVNIIAGTVSGSVFGGGNNIATDNAGILNSDVDMTGGTVLGSIYGGCNVKGTVTGNSVVTIYGGTLGSQSRLEGGTLSNIFGGGLGENTAVNGNVTVTVSRASGDAAPAAPTIYGDVYGGSRLGSVNDAAGDQTTVDILDGTLKSYVTTLGGFNVYNGGNVYGGGLGEAGPANVAKGQVNGVVTVNIGAGTVETSGTFEGFTTGDNSGNATIEGNVYGCNNTNGSPQQNVTVNIFKTAHTSTDTYSYTVDPVTNNITSSTIPTTYAIQNVFGGGNQADFRVDGKTTTVNIYGCDNTIRRTFGGGNAAATNEVFTMIQGGYVAEAFSGGNGEVTAANVYGDVNLGIHGGKIGQIFGGSNQQGTIAGASHTTLNSAGPCPGNTVVDEHFCGGKKANYMGDIVATISCSEGMTVNNLYGGCEEAHVYGSVTLTVYGGNFVNIYGGSKGTTSKGADIRDNVTLNVYGGVVTDAIFGGSNIKGAIGGTITVNVEDKDNTDACPLDVSKADVYGGGNVADYPGVPESDGPLYNSGNPITHPSPYNYPEVNIKNATVKNVFGGGLNAAVTGNPQVRIKNKAKVLGNVYGGGNMGQVTGDPKVIINGKMN